MTTKTIEKLLNISGFFFINGETYVGTLFKSKNDILLQLSINLFKEKDPIINSSNITGSILGTDITLTNCYVQTSLSKSHGIASKIIKADLIIIGKAYESDVIINELSCELPCISNFFSDSMLINVLDTEYPYLQKINEDAKSFTGIDNNGTIIIKRILTYSPCNNQKSNSVPTEISYKFNFPTTIDIGIQTIASARNLFAFFCNRNIPLNQLNIIERSANINSFNSYEVFFNYTQDELVEGYIHFIIQDYNLPDNFNILWNKWIKFCINNEYILDIYYEILCNRSTHTNEFNNLAQILEYYSRNNRNNNATIIAEADFLSLYPNKKFNKDRNTYLTHRLQDLFSVSSTFFKSLTQDKIIKLSKKISDARNFYTHLEKDARKLSYQELCYANRFLKTVVLLLIYDSLGINISSLNPNSIYSYYTVYPEDIELLLT